MITYDIGRSGYFWGIDKAYSVPLHFRTTVHENEHPFRTATAMGLRMPFNKAVLFGRWGQAATNTDKHLLDALRGSFIDPKITPKMA